MSNQKRFDERFNEDLASVMKNSQGRRVFKELLKRAGMEKCSFNGQSNHTIFNEGKRALGLEISNKLKEASPELFKQMLIEEEIYGD